MEGFLLNFTFCLCRITSSQWQAGVSQRTGPNTGSSETPGASSGESQAGPGLSPVPVMVFSTVWYDSARHGSVRNGKAQFGSVCVSTAV